MAKHVDHVFPWRQVGKHAFLHNIFQSLCGPCHSYKTGQEKHGMIEHYTPTGVENLTIDDYAMRVRVNP
jgi:5-methylcytosine-specific restriction endonuclease McrA